jgi:hypothetical protein
MYTKLKSATILEVTPCNLVRCTYEIPLFIFTIVETSNVTPTCYAKLLIVPYIFCFCVSLFCLSAYVFLLFFLLFLHVCVLLSFFISLFLCSLIVLVYSYLIFFCLYLFFLFPSFMILSVYSSNSFHILLVRLYYVGYEVLTARTARLSACYHFNQSIYFTDITIYFLTKSTTMSATRKHDFLNFAHF